MDRIKGVALTGAEIVIRCLQEEGVEHVFGYPGGAVLYIYDALFKQDKVKHVLVRHEQGAAHAADGYSRASNRVGVCLVTSGPGLTNAVTGIATAHMDSIPMVILVGQVPTHAIGLDAFQEVDTVGITRPCVKHNFLVKDVAELAPTIKKAFYLATTGRPGPVLVDIPKDITTMSTEFLYPETVSMRSYNPVTKGRTPLSVALSTDGLKWKKILDLETEPGEFSYPAIIQAADGKVHILYTWKRKTIAHVEFDPK